jgi:hypothetical protein
VATPRSGSDSDAQVYAVFNGLLTLTDKQRQQFWTLVRTYDDNNSPGKTEIRTKVARVSLGPLALGCPDELTPQPVDDEPRMLRPCGIPRSVYLKNRGDKGDK